MVVAEENAMRLMTVLFALVAILAVPASLRADAVTPAHVQGKAGDLTIHHVWSRATPPGARSGAAYLVIDNAGNSDDTLTAVSTPAASGAMIHETAMTNGVMTMNHVMALAIPAGKSVTFAPGGLHIMLMGLGAPLKAATSYRLTLTFEKAGTVAVDVPVLKPGQSLE